MGLWGPGRFTSGVDPAWGDGDNLDDEWSVTADAWLGAGELASAAVHLMEKHGIMALPVVDEEGRLEGIVHLHDLMRAGAV